MWNLADINELSENQVLRSGDAKTHRPDAEGLRMKANTESVKKMVKDKTIFYKYTIFKWR